MSKAYEGIRGCLAILGLASENKKLLENIINDVSNYRLSCDGKLQKCIFSHEEKLQKCIEQVEAYIKDAAGAIERIKNNS